MDSYLNINLVELYFRAFSQSARKGLVLFSVFAIRNQEKRDNKVVDGKNRSKRKKSWIIVNILLRPSLRFTMVIEEGIMIRDSSDREDRLKT